jgi:23S rRNA (adenine2503-C2)-methyltransferase
MTYEEIENFIVSEIGMPRFRASQIYAWSVKGAGFEEMSNLSARDREKLAQVLSLYYPKVSEKYVSQKDGTVKYLFELEDGQYIESVVMKYEHGLSICISSQVGCRMGCAFCASTIGGKIRDLTSGEMLGQIISAQRDLGERISNVVIMGIGEPFDNYDNVIRFLKIVTDSRSLGIGARHISLSTCGVVSGIDKLAELDLQITLSISLHAYDDEIRSSIMPINRKYNIDQLLSACVRYFDKTGRRISFEYTLISGKNDSEQGAQKLASLMKKYMGNRPFHINLIPVNPVKERGFTPSEKKGIKNFCDCLTKQGINATVRRTLGSDINASCGQLRKNRLNPD